MEHASPSIRTADEVGYNLRSTQVITTVGGWGLGVGSSDATIPKTLRSIGKLGFDGGAELGGGLGDRRRGGVLFARIGHIFWVLLRCEGGV